MTYRIVKVSSYFNETWFALTCWPIYCREHLNEEWKVALWTRLQRKCDDIVVDQGVNLAQVSLFICPSGWADSRFHGSVASIPRNPFTDSHAISSLTDVSVIELDRVEMSTFQDEDNGGRSCSFIALPSPLTSDQRQLLSWTWLPMINLSSTSLAPTQQRLSRATGRIGKVRC